jgi:hypothetical protein
MHLEFIKLVELMAIKGTKKILQCQNKIDFDVELSQKNYDKIYNVPYEDGIGQPY